MTTPMPVPPDVRAQGQPGPSGGSGEEPGIMRAQMPPNGPSQQQTIQQLQQKTDEFEKVTGELFSMFQEADPEGQALFVQLANVGKAIKQRVMELTKKAGQGAATPSPAPPASNPAEAPAGPVGAGGGGAPMGMAA